MGREGYDDEPVRQEMSIAMPLDGFGRTIDYLRISVFRSL